jgi:hypothetical protein
MAELWLHAGGKRNQDARLKVRDQLLYPWKRELSHSTDPSTWKSAVSVYQKYEAYYQANICFSKRSAEATGKNDHPS